MHRLARLLTLTLGLALLTVIGDIDLAHASHVGLIHAGLAASTTTSDFG